MDLPAPNQLAVALVAAPEAIQPFSPVLGGVVDSGCVLNEDSDLTLTSGRRGSSDSGRQPKKTAGRKPGPKTVAAVGPGPVEAMHGELGAALVVSDPSVKS